MNIWNFTGNLGRNSEVKYLPSGQAICTFSVAVSSGYGDNKKTTWANCALFGKQASSSLPEYLTQGTSVAVSGEVCLEEWESNGEKKKALKVNVIKIDLIGSSQGKNSELGSQQSKVKMSFGGGHSESGLSKGSNIKPKMTPHFGDSFDDSIPF